MGPSRLVVCSRVGEGVGPPSASVESGGVKENKTVVVGLSP